MKKFLVSLLALMLILGLCACGQEAASWQDKYDLGVRYLNEGNYDEAILAFNAAISIDPKRAEAYDKLADIYEETGNIEALLDILKKGSEETDDEALDDRYEDAVEKYPDFVKPEGEDAGSSEAAPSEEVKQEEEKKESPDTPPSLPDALHNETLENKNIFNDDSYIKVTNNEMDPLKALIEAGVAGDKETTWAEAVKMETWEALFNKASETVPEIVFYSDRMKEFWTQYDEAVLRFKYLVSSNFEKDPFDYFCMDYRKESGKTFRIYLARDLMEPEKPITVMCFGYCETSGWLLNGPMTYDNYAPINPQHSTHTECTAVNELLDGHYKTVTAEGEVTQEETFANGNSLDNTYQEWEKYKVNAMFHVDTYYRLPFWIRH